MEVKVRDNDVDQAIRKLKKMLLQDGVFKHINDKRHFTSKGKKRREDEKKQKNRRRKTLTKEWIQAGLDRPEAIEKATKGQRPPKIKQRHLK